MHFPLFNPSKSEWMVVYCCKWWFIIVSLEQCNLSSDIEFWNYRSWHQAMNETTYLLRVILCFHHSNQCHIPFFQAFWSVVPHCSLPSFGDKGWHKSGAQLWGSVRLLGQGGTDIRRYHLRKMGRGLNSPVSLFLIYSQFINLRSWSKLPSLCTSGSCFAKSETNFPCHGWGSVRHPGRDLV